MKRLGFTSAYEGVIRCAHIECDTDLAQSLCYHTCVNKTYVLICISILVAGSSIQVIPKPETPEQPKEPSRKHSKTIEKKKTRIWANYEDKHAAHVPIVCPDPWFFCFFWFSRWFCYASCWALWVVLVFLVEPLPHDIAKH